MERKLATIQRIDKLSPIKDADKIELANILGWQAVVQKGLYKENDIVIYVETDAILPEAEWSEFMRPHKFRIRTVRLRGQISQGLVFPITILPGNLNPLVGQDVTELLGIKLYDPPVPVQMAGKMKGNFPAFIPKTDKERIQNHPWLLEKYSKFYTEDGLIKFRVTEKLDGTSITIFYKDELNVCSKNINLVRDESNIYWKTVLEMGLDEKLKKCVNGMVLQGELIGGKIQGNPYNVKPIIYFYDAFNMWPGQYLSVESFDYVCKLIDIPSVPILGETYLPSKMEGVLQWATGRSALNDIEREGVVFRSLWEERDVKFGRLSFKVINPNYLLKHGG